MPIEFSGLPYAADALEPHVSARTLQVHHGKHHKAYVDKLNAAIAGTAARNSVRLCSVCQFLCRCAPVGATTRESHQWGKNEST